MTAKEALDVLTLMASDPRGLAQQLNQIVAEALQVEALQVEGKTSAEQAKDV